MAHSAPPLSVSLPFLPHLGGEKKRFAGLRMLRFAKSSPSAPLSGAYESRVAPNIVARLSPWPLLHDALELLGKNAHPQAQTGRSPTVGRHLPCGVGYFSFQLFCRVVRNIDLCVTISGVLSLFSTSCAVSARE